MPWNIYSLTSLIVIAGLTPCSACLSLQRRRRCAAWAPTSRRPRASPAPTRSASRINVSLPMILPAILFAGVLVFFLGFELFGLPLVLGDPQGMLVLSTYLYKLTNKLGVPSYQLMAVVVVVHHRGHRAAGVPAAPAAAAGAALRLGARQGPEGRSRCARHAGAGLPSRRSSFWLFVHGGRAARPASRCARSW